MRCAVRQFFQVQMSQRRIHHAVTARRNIHPTQLLHIEFVRCHLNRVTQRLADFAGVFDMERNLRRRALERINTPDFSLRPHHDLLGAGHPCKCRVHTMHRPRFLHVALQLAPCRCFRTGFQILQKQRRLIAHPPHKSEIFAVRRWRRANRPAGTADKGDGFAGLQIAAENLVNLGVGIFVVFKGDAGRGVL